MLSKFRVKNFRNFSDWFTLDLTQVKDYQFNPQCVDDGAVGTGLIYGPNACGKSNLARAIFDIQNHLTDGKIDAFYFNNYLHAGSESTGAEFEYQFKFGAHTIQYAYGKRTFEELFYERVKIDKDLIVERGGELSRSNIFLNVPGTEHLSRVLTDPKISVVNYIINNTPLLRQTVFGKLLHQMGVFVRFMKLSMPVKALAGNGQELPVDLHSFVHDPLHGGVASFQHFLNENGIACTLTTIKVGTDRRIAFDFGATQIEFNAIASHGTLALADAYVYLTQLRSMESAMQQHDSNDGMHVRQFIFLDEFDAFYHYRIAKSIVKALRDINVQALLTSHNTGIMSNDLLRPDCYFLMTEKLIKPMYSCTEKELRKAHNVEKMYKAGAFNG